MDAGEIVGQLLNRLSIPPRFHLFVVLGMANIISLIIGLLVGLEVRRRGHRRRLLPERTDSESEQEIRKLNKQIVGLEEQVKRFHLFMLDIPHVITRLNATVSKREVVSSIVGLAGKILQTGTAHLYLYHRERECLEQIHGIGAGPKEGALFQLGEGVVGRAARDMIVKSRGAKGEYGGFGDDYEKRELPSVKDASLRMASPIIIQKRLFGVVAAGDTTHPTEYDEILLKMVSEIAAVALANREFLGEAKKEASTDPLTGLFNRRYFFERAREYTESVVITGGSMCVFLFDIDHFKNYNDTNGHDEGDKLLKGLSELVLSSTRKTMVVARYGGEEFIVLLPDTSKSEAFAYADRLRLSISEFPFENSEKQPLGMVSISGGIACFPEDGGSIEETIRLADQALYAAKNAGRNRVHRHSSTLYEDEEEEHDPAAD